MIKNSLIATKKKIINYFDQLLSERDLDGYYYYEAVTLPPKREKDIPYMKVLKKQANSLQFGDKEV